MRTRRIFHHAIELTGADELLNIAIKVERLLYKVSREPEECRLAGRLNRLIQFPMSELTEEEIVTFAESHVRLAMAKHDLFLDRSGFYPLQLAIARVSYRMWEDLWNEKHPDRSGKAWEGEDVSLMWVWREKVLVTINECHQGAVLVMSAEEYAAELVATGADEEAAADLSEWLLEVMYEETTPSTEVVSEIEP